MATIPGFRLDITGASGSQGLLSPRQSWRAYVFPRGAFASQDSTGPLITFDSSSQASRFAVNNWIQVGTDTSKIVKVTAVGGNSISVNASVVVTTNDRIFLIGNTQPSVSGGSATYITPNTLVRQRGDDSATLYSNSMITTNANGLVQGFASPAMYDVLVQDGNGSNQGYVANLEVGTVEGVSVTDAAFFGNSVTISGNLVVGNSITAKNIGNIRYADAFAVSGSSTGGIQEAIEDCGVGGGMVMLTPGKTYTVTGTAAANSTIWLHSNITLCMNGATIQRGSASLSTARSVVNACAFGSNGTLPTSAGTLSNISLLGPGIVDGNFSNMGASVTGTGVEIKFTANVRIRLLTVQNCLQDGIALDECKYAMISDCYIDTVGKVGVASSRNGISLYNNSGTGNAAGFSRHLTVNNVSINDAKDEAITLLDVADVSISNITGTSVGDVIEFQTGSALAAGDNTSVTITNVSAMNFTHSAIVFVSQATNQRWNNVSISNCAFQGSTSSHDRNMFQLVTTGTADFNDIVVSNCSFTNFNTLDTNAYVGCNIQAQGTGSIINVAFTNCLFTGKSGSTRTADYGTFIAGNVKGAVFTSCVWRDIAGTGADIQDSGTNSVLEEVRFVGCRWESIGSHGAFIGCATATGTVRSVHFNSCTMKNVATQAGNYGWLIQNNAAGTTTRISIIGCRAWRTNSANFNYGVGISGANGTVSELTVLNCDLDTMNTGPILVASTPTNLHITPPDRLGTNISTAATITIPMDGTEFHVVGSTNITNGITVNPQDNGRLVVLIFDSTPTVSDTGTSVLNGNFVATANDTLTLKCDGTNWYELARSAN